MSEKSAPQPQLFRDIPGLTEAMIGVTPPVAPLPPPVERERPFGDWSISWEKFQQNLGEFGPAVKENFINIVKSGG
ncbi:hypothetical protein L6272_01785, partial [Microgenomates group bacterium]|nr:hypothetical protein [Microgenomates group bacterium]